MVKKAICIISIGLCLSLCGCGSKKNSYSLKRTTDITLTTESESDRLERLNKEADAIAATAEEVTSGVIYDSIKEIIPEAKLTRMKQQEGYLLGIHADIQEDSDFIGLSERLCKECNIESEYSAISIIFEANGNSLFSLTLSDYKSPYSFHSFFVLLDKNRNDLEEQYENSILNKEPTLDF